MNHRFNKLELEDPPCPNPLPAAGDPDDWLRRADRNRRLGLFEPALRDFSRAIESDRALSPAWAGQVRMFIALNHFTEARLWSGKAIDLFPDHTDLHAARATLLIRSGELIRAHAASDAALRCAGPSIFPWLARAELMLASNHSLADHCFNKALELNGDWLTAIEIAEILIHHRRFAAALPRCRRAAESAPREFYPWLLRGTCELHTGFNDAARLSLEQCAQINPRDDRPSRLLDKTARRDYRWLKRLTTG